MTWFNVDDGFYDHPKSFDASDAAVALWTRAGCWSARNLTDGFVPAGMLPRLSGDPANASRELCERGLWRRTRGGFQFHDWQDWNRSAERVRATRQANAVRQKRWREARSNGVTHASSNGVTNSAQAKPSQEEPEDSLRSSSARKRGTTIPADFEATPEMIVWAREHTPLVGRAETDRFVDYWRAVPGARGRKLDWVATWRNWMRKAQDDATVRYRAAERRPNADDTIRRLMLPTGTDNSGGAVILELPRGGTEP